MSDSRIWASRAVVGIAVLGGLASLAVGQPATLATGPTVTTEGFLEIQPDEFGAWAQVFAGGAGPNDDRYHPAGNQTRPVAFSAGFILFAGSTEREVLSISADWQAVVDANAMPFSADTSMDREVTTPNAASDTNADGIDDTATSAFRVFSATTDLAFTLTQHVSTVSGAVALFHQRYGVTNNGTSPLAFTMVRMFDGDLLWVTDATNDQVGTSCNSLDRGQFAFMREVDADATAITLSGGARGRAYVAVRQNDTPPDGPPIVGFGTDSEIWDAHGVPASWRNYVSSVGYDTDGVSGTITGSVDAFLALEFPFNLSPGQSTSFDVYHTWGQATPAPAADPCFGDVDGDHNVGLSDLARLLSNFGIGSGATLDQGDLDGDGDVDLGDLATLLANFGASCP